MLLLLPLASRAQYDSYESAPTPRFAHAGHPRHSAPLGMPLRTPRSHYDADFERHMPHTPRFAPLLPPSNEVNLHFLAHATTPAEARQHEARALGYQRRTYLPDASTGVVKHRPHSGGHPKSMVPGGGTIDWGKMGHLANRMSGGLSARFGGPS